MKAFSAAKKKLIAVIVCGAIFFAALSFYAFKPLIAGLEELHQQTAGEKDAYQQLLVEEASYRTAKVELTKIQDKVEAVRNLFPVREKLVSNVELLENAAAKFQNDFSLAITDVKQEEEQRGEPNKEPPPEYEIVPGLINVEVIPYDFHLEGSFLGIIRFLQTLEHQPFYSEIETLAINGVFSNSESLSASQRSRSGAVQAKIRAAFYAKQE